MKKSVKKVLGVVAFFAITGFVLISCNKTEADPVTDQGDSINKEYLLDEFVLAGDFQEYFMVGPGSCIDTFPFEDLSDGEIEAIKLMREEELLAKDVYTALYPVWNIPIFNNISKAENQHTTMIGLLIEKYELEDPGAGHEPGVFQNEDLQALYDALIEQGNLSLIDGLTVGATIEDVDIFDLEELMENVVDNQDITWVFDNLCRGSRNHMRAFYGNLVFRGADYVPQYISQEYFDEIISSQHEPGSGGCGGCNTQ